MKSFKKFVLIFVMLFLSLATLVNAVSWWGEANADFNAGGGNGFTGYASNYANIYPNQSYSICSFSGSSFTPLIADFDNNGVEEILVYKNSRLQLYSTDCEFITEIAVGSVVRAMPVLFNYNTAELTGTPLVVILTGSELIVYKYDSDNTIFSEFANFDYTDLTTDLDKLVCPKATTSLQTCVAFKKGQNEIYNFNIDTLLFEERENELPTITFNLGSVTQGTAGIRTYDSTDSYIPYCYSQGSTSNYFKCHTINRTGYNVSISSGDIGSASFAVTDIYYLSSYTAKMGNVYRHFLSIDYEKNNAFNRDITRVYDFGFTELYRVQTDDSGNETSNWVVADYNKDGINEACYLVNITGSITFICWDENFLTQTEYVNVTGVINLTKSLVLADFNSSQDYLGLATQEGIFYINSSNDITQEFSTGRTSNFRDFRSGIVISTGSTGSPVYVYSDDTETFIVRNSETSSTCGDGICDSYENSFSCAVDCSINISGLYDENENCEFNSDCESGYCEYGVCTLKPDNYDCTLDSQCLSGECSNNKCTKPNYWDSIDASKKSIFGSDSNTNNFIALFIMTAVAIGIIVAGRSFIAVLVGALMFILLGFFFAVVGWLSVFIAFGLIVLVLAMIILSVVLKMGSE